MMSVVATASPFGIVFDNLMKAGVLPLIDAVGEKAITCTVDTTSRKSEGIMVGSFRVN